MSPPAAGVSTSRRSMRQTIENRDGLTMAAPITLIVTAIIIVPILWTVLLSFQEARYSDVARNGLFNDLTLANYIDTVTAPGFWSSISTTVTYTVATTAGSIVVGFIAALALRDAFPARGAVRAAMLLPYVAPVVAAAYVWTVILDPQYGVVNAIGTRVLGWEEPVNFLGSAPLALTTVIAFEVWRYFPFAFMFFAAALTGLSREVEEAAVVDGATPVQRLWYVILPQMLPVIALLSLLRLVMTFNKFDDIYLLTGGAAGTQVAAVRVYEQLVGSGDIGAASANAVVLALILAAGLLVYTRITRRQEQR
ncbi:sugar ABC transporter permease [Myceligenerans sp. I2]|uniref:Sugar ABC transporter permease n=2 Tax=Myceligenerans indicum TaxID=2593663 RepID=A0ABS1LNZ7_9MICO|nr:sugar ABC transporter permease [Myceligenerans indicum]